MQLIDSAAHRKKNTHDKNVDIHFFYRYFNYTINDWRLSRVLYELSKKKNDQHCWPQHIERIPNQSLITSTGYITSISQTNAVVNQKLYFLKLFIPQ